MKIIHTSDWHLGHHIYGQSRETEHGLFLDWLINIIKQEQTEVLIIAGDIFDSGFPPNYAFTQYYQFLTKIRETPCNDVVIIGGNHDSPATLNAPRDLLKYLRIHVVGCIENDYTKEVIEINKNNTPICIVCAVPFFRLKDMKTGYIGESYDEKTKRMTQEIIEHYQKTLEHAVAMRTKLSVDIPIIATGHFFVTGGELTDSVRELHVGGSDRIKIDSFSSGYDYFALGHLHKSQRINDKDNIRYCGSPIPLSFGESHAPRCVLITDFQADRTPIVKSTQVPMFRKLEQIKGSIDNILAVLDLLAKNGDTNLNELQTWVEVQVDNDILKSDQEKIMQYDTNRLKILKLNTNLANKIQSSKKEVTDLSDLTPKEVFRKRFEQQGLDETQYPELEGAFMELLSELNENE